MPKDTVVLERMAQNGGASVRALALDLALNVSAVGGSLRASTQQVAGRAGKTEFGACCGFV